MQRPDREAAPERRIDRRQPERPHGFLRAERKTLVRLDAYEGLPKPAEGLAGDGGEHVARPEI
jgi:hypothetical protein